MVGQGATKMLILGNWKMNKTIAEAIPFASKLATMDVKNGVEVGVLPPFLSLSAVASELEGSSITFGAQNCHHEDSGAFTGEISAPMLSDLGCNWCLVGHSERRQYFSETNETIRQKIVALLRHGVAPVLCIGESLVERNNDRTFAVLSAQISKAICDLDLGNQFVIAYEPIWAIGTGLVPTPKQVSETAGAIKELAAKLCPKTNLKVLYGGSVDGSNCESLAVDNIDGFLVGSASLSVTKFEAIINNCTAHKE